MTKDSVARNDAGERAPVPVSELADWLPHRGRAVWIDFVTRGGELDGECRVVINPEAAYACNGALRPSSYVEWIAQAFGFAQALAYRDSGHEGRPERVFLAAIKNLEIVGDPGPLSEIAGQSLSVQVRKTHQVGPVALVDGTVLGARGEVLARAQLKLFAG